MINNIDLINVYGGATNIFSATFLNAFVRFSNFYFECGRYLGTVVKNLISGTKC